MLFSQILIGYTTSVSVAFCILISYNIIKYLVFHNEDPAKIWKTNCPIFWDSFLPK